MNSSNERQAKKTNTNPELGLWSVPLLRVYLISLKERRLWKGVLYSGVLVYTLTLAAGVKGLSKLYCPSLICPSKEINTCQCTNSFGPFPPRWSLTWYRHFVDWAVYLVHLFGCETNINELHKSNKSLTKGVANNSKVSSFVMFPLFRILSVTPLIWKWESVVSGAITFWEKTFLENSSLPWQGHLRMPCEDIPRLEFSRSCLAFLLPNEA